MTKETKFYKALRDVFIGAKIEGEGGFINLMRIKAGYYSQIEKLLKEDVNQAVEKYPTFREELFDKLHSFFSRYFTESGSIYFNSTPFHNNIYEKVYTDEKDVILFWKTQMLYYVKTDRIFRSLPIEFPTSAEAAVGKDGLKFYFDASKIETKKANEKRSLIFELGKVCEDETIVFSVQYSERGAKTKQEEILKAIKKKGIAITEEQLERAFRIFEKQSEVDFFINKNARAFLQEQFKLWSYQYFWEGAKEWSAVRVNQLQILKDIAFKIIDFISQFEDELVKIWNKPKFVRKSNYVITLDRIKDEKLIKKILKHKNIKEQIKEWQELGIVDKEFRTNNVLEKDLTGTHLAKKYEHLPIDTKYFKDLEPEILSLFDDLDESLDGWLIKSENYQALNTILPKFKEKVQTIYIDPPFNTGEDFDYVDRFQDSSWLSILNDRLDFAKLLLDKSGNIFLHLDFNADYYGRFLLNNIFGQENFSNEIKWYYTNKIPDTRKKSFTNSFDVILTYAKSYEDKVFNWLFDKREKPIKVSKMKKIDGKKIYLKGEDGRGIYDLRMERTMDNIWQIPLLHAQPEIVDFKTQKPEELIRRIIACSQGVGIRTMVMDFFAGSGTTSAVSHKLGNKWLGVEMGEHFYSVILPRMKKVLAYDKSGISKEVKEYQGGGFFKYYELEQYEEALANCKYKDGDLFNRISEKAYQDYVFLKDEKMLKALEIDYKNKKIKVDLNKLYPDIDMAETLSNLTGKWIKKIEANKVWLEGMDNPIDTKNLDYKLIKPLIWWE